MDDHIQLDKQIQELLWVLRGMSDDEKRIFLEYAKLVLEQERQTTGG